MCAKKYALKRGPCLIANMVHIKEDISLTVSTPFLLVSSTFKMVKFSVDYDKLFNVLFFI